MTQKLYDRYFRLLHTTPFSPNSKSFKKMMIPEEPSKTPENPSRRRPEINGKSQKLENIISPRFRSVAAMAGWDEEALLIASLIVEDTPDRQLKQKKRSDLPSFKTPPSNSRRKRRAQRISPASIPITVLNMDEDESKSKQVSGGIEEKVAEKKKDGDEVETKKGSDASISSAAIPFPSLDRLREELSCAICLEICYEPSTTPCGHSFCKKCLSSAADRCGKKCPKCRQLISNSKHCTVNTVLWNTIQLLFPQEVEARKPKEDAPASDNREPQRGVPARNRSLVPRNRSIAALNSPESETRDQRMRNRRSRPSGVGGSAVLPNQDIDAALALRLQREEFMEAFGANERRNLAAVSRAHLRAMASRAHGIRIRGQRE